MRCLDAGDSLRRRIRIMRVCMLNDNFYRGSGITVAITRLLDSPAYQDIEVYLAGCERLAGGISPNEDTRLVSSERYRSFALMSSGAGLLAALYGFIQWVKKMRFDVIHVHHRRLAVLAHLVRNLTNVPVLFTGHLTFTNALWFRELSPRAMTGVSPSVVDYLQRSTKAVEISLVFNPVNFATQRARAVVFSQRRVVSIGRLEKVKGLETLLHAWAMLRRKGVQAHLDIIGEGSLRESLVATIKKEQLESSVTLVGFATDIIQRLPAYSFNVLVSEKEGFPNSVVEAAACGIPTLLTAVDGSRDALPPGLRLPNGLRFGDALGLCAALEQWLSTPELLQADGRSFHDYLINRCSPEVVGSQYLNIYSSLRRKPLPVFAS